MGFLLFMSQHNYRILEKNVLGESASQVLPMLRVPAMHSIYKDLIFCLACFATRYICSRGFIERTHHSLSFIQQSAMLLKTQFYLKQLKQQRGDTNLNGNPEYKNQVADIFTKQTWFWRSQIKRLEVLITVQDTCNY